MLVNIEPIQTGASATPNLWNQRFAALTEVINGNIDSDNLKSGAVTNDKIANGAVTSDKLDIEVYIDDNGWTVQNLGTVSKYFKRVNMGTETIPAHSWSSHRPILNLPVGVTVEQVRGGTYLPVVSVISNTAGWAALTASLGIDNTEDGFVTAIMNTDNTAKTLKEAYVTVMLERAV